MFASDLLRIDTLILLLMEAEGKAVGAGELSDALSEMDIDLPTFNVGRELRFMQERAFVHCSGYTLRNGRNRMRLYELTDTGRATAAQRRSVYLQLLHEPPEVSDAAPLSHAEGWS